MQAVQKHGSSEIKSGGAAEKYLALKQMSLIERQMYFLLWRARSILTPYRLILLYYALDAQLQIKYFSVS